MECKNILIVEDDLAITQTMKDVLEVQGYSVFIATNGEDGLRLLKELHPVPCLILLDLMMPYVNGWQFLDVQRASVKYSHIPIVICSAYAESAKAIKPNGFLEKPLQYAELMETVKKFCA